MSLGLYLHIPYCFSKCRYCDFYSHPGERGVPDAYVDALLRELSRFAPEAPLQPDTLYFGGGTPSLLRPEQAKRLIDAARPMPGAEITLEANPETVTEESLAGFREAGVNRISFVGAVCPGYPAAHTGQAAHGKAGAGCICRRAARRVYEHQRRHHAGTAALHRS